MPTFDHLLLDALRDRRGFCPQAIQTADDQLYEDVWLVTLQAEKFDFGTLPLEPEDEAPDSIGKLPIPTDEELEFIREGLIPLPAPIVWFEFRWKHTKIAFIVFEDDKKWTMYRAYRDGHEMAPELDHGVIIEPHTVLFDRTQSMASRDTVTLHLRPTAAAQQHPVYDQTAAIDDAACDLRTFIYMLLMINSRSTEVTRSAPPMKLNKARVKKSKTPLSSHRIVTIVPRHMIDRGDGHGGSHASPKLHWRRSHLRIYPSGKKAVVVRHIVGRADLGELTHEYRVKAGDDD